MKQIQNKMVFWLWNEITENRSQKMYQNVPFTYDNISLLLKYSQPGNTKLKKKCDWLLDYK